MIITCERKLHICAGHRVFKHESKCNNLHGHNYVIWVTAQAPQLDGLGRIIDFGVIKEKLGSWLDRNWDHGMILFKDDPLCAFWQSFDDSNPFSGHKHYILPYNPTAENMARYLLKEICPMLFEGDNISIVKVKVWETENCIATAEKENQ